MNVALITGVTGQDITRAPSRIALRLQEKFYLGNLDAKEIGGMLRIMCE